MYMIPEKSKTEKLVRELRDNLNALANHKQLIITCDQKNLPKYIIADTDLLKRGLINVLSNAVDYSKQGGKISFIVEGDTDTLRFIIADNGEGFSDEDIQNAYKKFYMKEKSRSSKDHYGMGLYITNMIIKLHNGKLILGNSFDSNTGGKVIVEIPLCLEKRIDKKV